MTFTSINISNNEHKFKYIISFNKDENVTNKSHFYISNNDNINIYDINDHVYWKKNNNIWESLSNTSTYISGSGSGGTESGSGGIENGVVDLYIPDILKISSIDLYFPEYSLDVYENGIKYALTINTWINNKIIYLGTHIIDRNDIVAAEKVRSFYNQKYYEKINIKFIDPRSIIYDDDWKQWREILCDSKVYDDIELNNNGSIINFTLHPVMESNDSSNIYIKYDKYFGGQNSINLDNSIYNNLKYDLVFRNDLNPEVDFKGVISFNTAYEQTYDGLIQYLKETYNIYNPKLEYEFYIQDKENIYDYFKFDTQDIKCNLTKTDLNRKYPENHKYTSWDEFIDGMYINSTFNIYDNDSSITIMSNEIPLTQEVFKYLIFTHENSLNYIKLNIIDMNNYDLNIVNKIQNNIIQVDRPKDYKSNIIKPVYYKTRDLSNIVIHPEITENICINLDGYKYLVDSFIIRIEGINFLETARVPAGVVFKIIGNKLANKQQTGTYYILNQDSELITTGKYTYEI